MTPDDQILSLLDFLKERRGSTTLIGLIPSSEEEWDGWFDHARAQGVAPLLYFRIKQYGIEQNIPSRILNQLQRAYHQNAAQNLSLSHELEKTIRLLNKQGIPVLVLKGAYLAFNIYSNPALRTMSDLDILVPPAHIQAAINALLDVGYLLKNPVWLESAYHFELLLKEKQYSLEVHWELTDAALNRIFPIDEIWERRALLESVGGSFYTMEKEDLLIYLCQHTSVRHLFTQGTRALCDVDVVIRYYGNTLGWETIYLRADAWNLKKAVALTLYLCEQYLDTPLPGMAVEKFGLRHIDPSILEATIRQLSSAIVDSNAILPSNIVIILNQERSIGFIQHFMVNIFRPFFLPLQNLSFLMKLYYSFRRMFYLANKYLGDVRGRVSRDPAILQQLQRQRNILKWLRM